MTLPPRKIFDRDLPPDLSEDRRGHFDADGYSRILNLPEPETDFEPARKIDLEAAVAAVTPRPYDVYTAWVSQSGTDNPVATEFENSIGTITWARTDVGIYTATSDGKFIDGQLYFLRQRFLNVSVGVTLSIIGIERVSDDVIQLTCESYPSASPADLESIIALEIRIYNP